MGTWTWVLARVSGSLAGTMGAGVVAGGLLGGCTTTVESSPPPPPVASGTAVMDWTISESKNPIECGATGTSTFNVSLRGSSGALAGQWVQDCQAFATTISGLFPDTYTGEANLLDSGGTPRTTSVPLAPFTVLGGTSITVAVDFPPNSFY